MKGGQLIDLAIRESYRKAGLVPSEFSDRLIRARKFVLDEAMSSFLADLSNAATMEAIRHQRDDDGEAVKIIMDGARRMARAPFPTTWIEYDCRARRRRSHEAWEDIQIPTSGAFAKEEEICPKVGWLIEEHPGIEGAYKMTEFVQWADVNDQGKHAELAGRVCPMPYALTWVSDDTLVIPWQSLPFSNKGRRPSEIATGIMGYLSPHVGISPTETTKSWVDAGVERGVDALHDQLLETMGELRAVFMLLASLNRIPAVYDAVRPSKGYFAKGRIRKFMEHTIIKLTLPAHRSMKVLAMRCLVPIRHKRHPVRGFWRNDWRHPRTAGCAHVWINFDEHTLACTHCDGRMVHVKAHERGDARLGYVIHDYSVERGAA